VDQGAREAAGLPPGTGPYKVISTLGLMGFDPRTMRMQVESLHPGVTKEQVIENTGFELLFAEESVHHYRRANGARVGHPARRRSTAQGKVIGKVNSATAGLREVVEMPERKLRGTWQWSGQA
jgi:hypothetical protein